MDLLIDTHVLLSWDGGGGSLGPAVRNVIADRNNRAQARNHGMTLLHADEAI